MNGNLVYFFSPAQYAAVQQIVGNQMDLAPQRTRLALRNELGEEGADRFLEQLGLGDWVEGPDPSAELVANLVATPYQQ
jgi:hypothetical protein